VDITKIKFTFLSYNPSFVHSNGIKIWILEGKSEKILGYGETSSTGLSIRELVMPETAISAMSGWGVPLDTENDLF